MGVISATVTFSLLAPFQCQTRYTRYDPIVGKSRATPQHCEGLVAFEYSESSLLQAQTLVTSASVGALAALIAWLLGSRPRLGESARAILSMVLVAITVLAATDVGGVIIYAAPVLIPLFSWMAYQASLLARIAWAVLGSLVAVEALALITYESTGLGRATILVAAGLAVGLVVLTASRWISPLSGLRPGQK